MCIRDRLDRVTSSTSGKCPADVASLCSPLTETGAIMEHNVISEEGQRCDSGIHWQVICVHEVQNGPMTGPRGMSALMRRTQEHALSTLTLRVPLVKDDCIRFMADDSSGVWVSLKRRSSCLNLSRALLMSNRTVPVDAYL